MSVPFKVIVPKINQLACHSFTGDRYLGYPLVVICSVSPPVPCPVSCAVSSTHGAYPVWSPRCASFIAIQSLDLSRFTHPSIAFPTRARSRAFNALHTELFQVPAVVPFLSFAPLTAFGSFVRCVSTLPSPGVLNAQTIGLRGVLVSKRPWTAPAAAVCLDRRAASAVSRPIKASSVVARNWALLSDRWCFGDGRAPTGPGMGLCSNAFGVPAGVHRQSMSPVAFSARW